MFAFKKLKKITYGVLGGAAAVALVWGCTSDKKRTVWASWTTNHTPSSQWDHNWDRRDPKNMVKPVKSPEEENKLNSKIEKATPVASRHLFLIRHGQYFMNGELEESKFLTELGKVQADLTGKRLKELGHNYTSIVHSTMIRAAQTAEIISKHLETIPMMSCDLLREGAPIPPEPPVGHWKPEIQQFYEDGARIEAAFRKYFHRAEAKQEKDSYEIFVCHANVIRYFVCRALQFPPEAWLRIGLNNSSITTITIRPSGRVYLRTLGDSGHIPAEKLTTL